VARRGLTKQLSPEDTRKAVKRHLYRLMTDGGVNLAQFKAQQHEEKMVQILVDFAMDDISGDTLSHREFRAKCARDVLLYARGPVTPWIHSGQTINPQAIGPSGATVGAEIEAARQDAAMLAELDAYANVPYSSWPEELRDRVGEMGRAFADLEAQEREALGEIDGQVVPAG
jgi:hypothetical protein